MTDPEGTPASALERELVAEGARKAGLCWLAVGEGRARAAWHVADEWGPLLVCDGAEQPLPELIGGGAVRVTLPSKDTRARLVTFTARVTLLLPDSIEWAAAAEVLHAQRLNPPDGEEQPRRWARESRVIRLIPTGEVSEAPGRMPSVSHAAAPAPTSATTRGPLPFVLGRATGRKRIRPPSRRAGRRSPDAGGT